MLILSATDTCSTRDWKANAIGHQIEDDNLSERAEANKMICMQIGGANDTSYISGGGRD
jgi:hypothetical protein